MGIKWQGPMYSKAKLPFALRGEISPGCRYVIAKWKAGQAKDRILYSCHRELRRAKVKLIESDTGRGGYKKAIYDLKTGKRVKWFYDKRIRA